MFLKNNGFSAQKIILLIFNLIHLFSFSLQIAIPLKQIKTKFQKTIPRKITSNSDFAPSISDHINTLDNYLFVADLIIGSNKKTFTILLDTGSEIFWVSGNRYNPSNSVTSTKSTEKLNYEYSSGKVEGNYYNDQINFLLSQNYYVYFGVSTQTNLLDYFFDGIMGLGRKYSNTKYSVLQTIKNIGGISSTKFSFKYDYNTNNLYFYLGEEHEDFKSTTENIASCPLIDSDYYGKNLWLCEIASFGIKNQENLVKVISLDLEVLFDTGTNNIVLPSKYISYLEPTFKSFDCFLYEEGDNSVGSQKSVYCRNQNNLPKIVIGLRQYRLTIGKSNFYTRLYINQEYIYRLRLLFINVDFCIIGQNFFYEYHTLFDDEKGVLKFYGGEEIVYYLDEKEESINWITIILIIAISIIIIGIIIIIILCICRKKKYSQILLNKELLEMSSIKKVEDSNDNYQNNFNQIMSITSDKIKKGINIKINT